MVAHAAVFVCRTNNDGLWGRCLHAPVGECESHWCLRRDAGGSCPKGRFHSRRRRIPYAMRSGLLAQASSSDREGGRTKLESGAACLRTLGRHLQGDRRGASNTTRTRAHPCRSLPPPQPVKCRRRAPVAQWIEQPPPKGQVARSIRVRGARTAHHSFIHGGVFRHSDDFAWARRSAVSLQSLSRRPPSMRGLCTRCVARAAGRFEAVVVEDLDV